MLRLHNARTENPVTPQTHLSASSFHEYHSDTSRHPPDIPQTPLRHLQGTQDVNRRQNAPTDTSRHTQTAPVSVRGCLGVSVGVCWRLWSSVDILIFLEMSWGVWGMSRGCLWVFEWHSWKSEVLRCVWGVSGFSVLAVCSCSTTLAQP